MLNLNLSNAVLIPILTVSFGLVFFLVYFAISRWGNNPAKHLDEYMSMSRELLAANKEMAANLVEIRKLLESRSA
ncbi:hypothetical protein GGR16_004148 [Chelatococcus caeni]|uniref:Uncharacterized protein n=1 Tax=Chelatococcus caeni TaxID=1348468 RepID=A0A840BZW8_9HYPH|nr:hypothetical protein [Chelatococcus caeni]MBB4019101.1 hypothetical protein [Chelatococcus caeni]